MSQNILKYKVLLFYTFTFAISWSAWFLMSRLYDGGQPTAVIYVLSSLGGLGPLISFFILEKLSNAGLTVKQVLPQINIRGAKAIWILLAIFAWPLLTILGNVGYTILGREEAFRLIVPGPDMLGVLVIPVMAIQFAAALITSPLFEEPGWRGFALTELQTKFGREAGSLVVGVLWWAWHQPMNLTFGLQPTLYAAISMVALSFMFDSLFNLSGKNLFIPMLAHQSSGTVLTFLYQGTDNLLQLGLLIGFVIILRVRESTRTTAPIPV